MRKKQRSLEVLFIDDLGQVKGGVGETTTQMLGEEDVAPRHHAFNCSCSICSEPTTLALGEEDGGI